MSDLMKRLKEERIQGSSAVLNYSNFDYWVNWDDIVEIVEDHEQPQLNENQQIVLEYIKYKFSKQPVFLRKTIFYPIGELFSNKCDDDVNDAFDVLDLKQEAEVLQAFSQWVLEQEEE